METEQTVELCPLPRIGTDAVGSEPVFIQPDIDQEDRDESSEVEDVLLNRHAAAHRRRCDAQCRAWVGKCEERPGKKEVQSRAQGEKDSNGPPERALRYPHALERQIG